MTGLAWLTDAVFDGRDLTAWLTVLTALWVISGRIDAHHNTQRTNP